MTGAWNNDRQSDSDEKTHGERTVMDTASTALILSGLLRDPSPRDEDEARSALETLSELDPEGFGKYRGAPEEFQRDWNAAMEPLAGGAVPPPMEESLYKPWTSDAAHPLYGNEGLAWGDPAHHMLDVLERFGLALEPGDERAPDHIAVLFEFLAHLLENRPREEARSFCTDHLDWLPALEKRLEDAGAPPALALTVRAARKFVSTLISSN
jgi:hypothetical protein